MADQAPTKTARMSGWLKTVICTVIGIFSGAVVMYFTQFIDTLIKPAKPLANFGIEHQGLTVTFVNRSTGAVSGWWDFGDGTPLEPVDLAKNTITHAYPQPGSYTAKLSLSNFLNEQSERTVNVQIDTAAAPVPVIESLEATPLSPESYAPATFRVSAKVKNAELCIYDFGGKHAMKVLTDPANAPDQIVMFRTPGPHTVKLLAVAGKKTIQLQQVVNVKPAARGMASAILTVTDQATQVEKLTVTETVGENFPANTTASVAKFDRQIQARAGFTMTDAKLLPYTNANARNLRLEVAQDRKSVRLTGELVRPVGAFGRKGPPPSLVVQVAMVQEQQSPASRAPIQLAASLTVPGTATIPLPPLPANWINVRRAVQLQVQDENKVVWQEAQLPNGSAVTILNKPCRLTATVVGNSQIRVDLVEAKGLTGPVAN
jgi:PKD repeat protein